MKYLFAFSIWAQFPKTLSEKGISMTGAEPLQIQRNNYLKL